MKQIAAARGHVVYVRCPTEPRLYEAACECGYRSARFFDEGDAIADAQSHAEKAPTFHGAEKHTPKPKPKAKARKKTARGK